MPLVSVIILTKNRKELLRKALESVERQTFRDFEILVVDDGSTDGTEQRLKDLRFNDLKIFRHEDSKGIIQSRIDGLAAATGELVAFLDDDDEWMDDNKLQKQVDYFKAHKDCVIVGGGIEVESYQVHKVIKLRAETDKEIRKTMLLRNNFFTSTVMFRKSAALAAGGFVNDGVNSAEDYDLWLRLGQLGTMYNFQQVFTRYRKPEYNKARLKEFFAKQLRLIKLYKKYYPYFWLAWVVLKVRTMII
jgi:glycosyltransferase involved in cell wall biosynthesis